MNKPKCSTTHHLACDCREAYFRELEKENRGFENNALALIDERDYREEQINQIADILGDHTEWTSQNDRGENAIDLANQAQARIEELEEHNEELAEILHDLLYNVPEKLEKNPTVNEFLLHMSDYLGKARQALNKHGLDKEPSE